MQLIWKFVTILIFLEAIHPNQVVSLNSGMRFIHICLIVEGKVVLVDNELLNLLEDKIEKLLPSHPRGQVDYKGYIDQLHRVG